MRRHAASLSYTSTTAMPEAGTHDAPSPSNAKSNDAAECDTRSV